MEAYPEALKRGTELDSHYTTPFKKAPVEVGVRTLSACAGAAEVQDKQGKYPLHHAARKRRLWRWCPHCCQPARGGRGAGQKRQEPAPPCHYEQGASGGGVRTAVACAVAAGRRTIQGKNLLHHVLRRWRLSRWCPHCCRPAGAAGAGQGRQEPATMHRAWAPLEVVPALLHRPAEAAEAQDKEGKARTHFITPSTSRYLWRWCLLLSACPGAAQVRTKRQNPLHHAITNKAPLEVVSTLLSACAVAAEAQDNQGRTRSTTPRKQAPVEVVSLLLEAFPEGVRRRPRTTGYLYIGNLCRRSYGGDIITVGLS